MVRFSAGAEKVFHFNGFILDSQLKSAFIIRTKNGSETKPAYDFHRCCLWIAISHPLFSQQNHSLQTISSAIIFIEYHNINGFEPVDQESPLAISYYS